MNAVLQQYTPVVACILKKKMMTTIQNKQLHRLLHDTGLADHKHELVGSFTNGRSTSSKDMTERESWSMIAYLNACDKTSIQCNTMRRKILSMAHQMNWKLENGKVDMVHVNEWCVKYGFGHKPLNDYEVHELPKLLTVFETIYKQNLNIR